ncbi:MAG: hypothetical protein JWQ18_309, partial [Conexibacter sp.]|nr:hypothetical protein [Conexibacter sp.]
PAAEPSWRAPAAIVLLLLGGFVAGAGWLVGVVLLWASPRWSVGDKLVGTLVFPGGLLGGVFALGIASVGGTTTCYGPAGFGGADIFTSGAALGCDGGSGTSSLTVVALGLLVLMPIATAIFLAARLRPNRA